MTGRVLLVEDDAALQALYQRVLLAHGFEVELAATGSDGLSLAAESQFDAIVTDIAMPQMDGVRLLERLRVSDPLVPVLLLTGQAGVESVQRAIELRAFRYLIKPVDLRALVASVRRATSCCRWLRAREAAARSLRARVPNELEQPDLGACFDDALSLMRVYYPAVVDARRRQLRGFRSELRSLHPMFPSFADLRTAADILGRREELRRKLWSMTAAPLGLLDPSLLLFVWTDLAGLTDVLPHGALHEHARQTVLMVSDRQGADGAADERPVLASLRAAGYRLGVDQLGEGYAALSSLAGLEPEFLELEAALVQGVARDPDKRRLVSAVSELAKDLGATLVAEGVAGEQDAEFLAGMGCELFSWGVDATPDDLAPCSARAVSEPRALQSVRTAGGPLPRGDG